MHLLLLILSVAALITAIASVSVPRCPLWVSVMLLCFVACLTHLPK